MGWSGVWILCAGVNVYGGSPYGFVAYSPSVELTVREIICSWCGLAYARRID